MQHLLYDHSRGIAMYWEANREDQDCIASDMLNTSSRVRRKTGGPGLVFKAQIPTGAPTFASFVAGISSFTNLFAPQRNRKPIDIREIEEHSPASPIVGQRRKRTRDNSPSPKKGTRKDRDLALAWQ